MHLVSFSFSIRAQMAGVWMAILRGFGRARAYIRKQNATNPRKLTLETIIGNLLDLAYHSNIATSGRPRNQKQIDVV
jgi:hypothetical protein